MALRPNNHITGDSAVRKIASDLIPEEWTISIPDSDYGLDMLVEIVRDNKTTGKLFFIQSKGTTESSHEGAISFSMNLDRIKDYSEIKLPVLFVYYSKTEKRFWGRWMNSLFNTLTEEQKQQGTISLHFSHANVIDANYLRSIGDAIVPSITNSVSLMAAEMPDQFIRLHSQILATANKLIGPDIVSDPHLSCKSIILSYKGTLQDGSVEFGSDSFVASIPLRLSSPDILYYPPLAREECPPCVLEIIYAIALFSSSFSSQSFDYSLALPQREALDDIPDGVWLDLLSRVDDENVYKVQGLFDLAVQTNHYDLAQYILLVVFDEVLKSHKKNSAFYNSLLSHYLESEKDESSKGRICYSLANSMRQTDCREAFELYFKAVHYEPFYRKLFYWWEEVGGILYLTSHYSFAELFYKHARKLSPNECREDICMLIADCMICQGKIKEALSEESFFEAHKNKASSILLKSHVTEMMDKRGVQVFDPVYWFNQGVSCSREGNHEDSANAFLIAWRLYDGDLEALVNAFIESYNSREDIKAALILTVIRDQAQEEGYKKLVSLVSKNNENLNIGVFLDAIKGWFFSGVWNFHRKLNA